PARAPARPRRRRRRAPWSRRCRRPASTPRPALPPPPPYAVPDPESGGRLVGRHRRRGGGMPRIVAVRRGRRVVGGGAPGRAGVARAGRLGPRAGRRPLEGPQDRGDPAGDVVGAAGHPEGEVRAGVAHRGYPAAYGADAAFGGTGGDAAAAEKALDVLPARDPRPGPARATSTGRPGRLRPGRLRRVRPGPPSRLRPGR